MLQIGSSVVDILGRILRRALAALAAPGPAVGSTLVTAPATPAYCGCARCRLARLPDWAQHLLVDAVALVAAAQPHRPTN